MMSGWKTWTAVAGALGTGVVMVSTGVLSEPVNPEMIWQGILACVGAVGMLGIGHKIEKK